MTTPVNFEIAKLLKGKGFEERPKSYNKDGELFTVSLSIRRFKPEEIYYPAPSIAEVVMWLYDKHDSWITVSYNYFCGFMWEVQGVTKAEFFTPTECYTAAIEYTLNNLI